MLVRFHSNFPHFAHRSSSHRNTPFHSSSSKAQPPTHNDHHAFNSSHTNANLLNVNNNNNNTSNNTQHSNMTWSSSSSNFADYHHSHLNNQQPPQHGHLEMNKANSISCHELSIKHNYHQNSVASTLQSGFHFHLAGFIDPEAGKPNKYI